MIGHIVTILGPVSVIVVHTMVWLSMVNVWLVPVLQEYAIVAASLGKGLESDM